MSESDQKIVVSACLAGVPCNYKGEARPHSVVVALVASGRAVVVCPERLGGQPVPRLPAERVGDRVVTRDGTDVTESYMAGAIEALRIAQENGCKVAYLKSRSPSCGKEEIFNGKFNGTLVKGNGITAQLFIDNGIEVKSEKDL